MESTDKTTLTTSIEQMTTESTVETTMTTSTVQITTEGSKIKNLSNEEDQFKILAFHEVYC